MHYTSGKLTPIEERAGAIRFEIEGFAEPHRAHCMSVLGWAARSIELSGGAGKGRRDALSARRRRGVLAFAGVALKRRHPSGASDWNVVGRSSLTVGWAWTARAITV